MGSVHVSEIQPGLVLHLDPTELRKTGASVIDKAGKRLQPGRLVSRAGFFVCLAVDATGHSQWLPTFTNPAVGNIEIPSTKKTGHAKWTQSPTHYNPHQKWDVAMAAIPGAAQAGKDASHVGSRNGVRLELIAELIAGL